MDFLAALICVAVALAGGMLIGYAVGWRAGLEGWAAGREASHNQMRWQHEDPTDSAGA